jgi:glycerol-3-phosphate dehydrogenase subunit C
MLGLQSEWRKGGEEMQSPGSRVKNNPQEILRMVMTLCADCDVCRTLMDEDCVFFPELYRLHDQEHEQKVPITSAQLRQLANLCTLCGICPCPRIPMKVMEAKSLFVDTEGLPLATRLLAAVPRMAKLAGSFPRLTKAVQSNQTLAPLLKKALKLHPERQLPVFPQQNFFQWARQKGLTARKEGGRTVAYFAGCTAGYLFPQVGRATVEVLQRNGVSVFVPPQECCGMPHLAEGARDNALRRARNNLEQLLESVQAGEELLCSCPTCGYFLKVLLKERAQYSEAFTKIVEAEEAAAESPRDAKKFNKLRSLKKSDYKNVMIDDGYFSSIDPIHRINLSKQIADVGEYLARLHGAGQLDTRFGAINQCLVYYAPCHQRQQKIGTPYLDLLALIPGLSIEPVGTGMDCCGMGGNFGFKADFHAISLVLGRPLMEKIRACDPQAIVTDCLSCALQFRQVLPCPVFHPVEILARAYQADGMIQALGTEMV